MAPSAPHTRPKQRLSRPPSIQKLGAQNHMLQLNIWCSWWWAYVPETCRAKNTSIKSPCCMNLAFQIISWGRWGVKQPSSLFLTLILLMWRIGWAPNNANKWQIGYNSAFKGLMSYFYGMIYRGRKLGRKKFTGPAYWGNSVGLYSHNIGSSSHFPLIESTSELQTIRLLPAASRQKFVPCFVRRKISVI